MNLRQKRQSLCFTIEGLNSFGTVLYFTYLYFLLHDRFGFSDKARLAVAALLGLCYAVSSWQAGRLAQRWGYFAALKLGLGIMAGALLVGAQLNSAAGEIISAVVVTLGMCFTWPVLEALISENETPDRVPHAVGIYNITWAATNASALFIGGTLIEKLGYPSIFYIPAGIVAGQIALTLWLEKLPLPAAVEKAGVLSHDQNRPVAGPRQKFSAARVAGESVRLHRHQHAHRHAAGRRGEVPPHADVGRLRLFARGVLCGWARSWCCGAGRAGITASAGW